MQVYNITQYRSSNGLNKRVLLHLKTLGLRGIGTQSQIAVSPSSTALVKKLAHLVKHTVETVQA